MPDATRLVAGMCHAGCVPATLDTPRTDVSPDVDLHERLGLDTPWRTVVWNDPVNLMSYVVYVFRSYFGFPKPEAERLMLQVHNGGKATVAEGSREAMERHVAAMHDYGLWATLEQVPQ
jgi:Uncharacterized conserved protein